MSQLPISKHNKVNQYAYRISSLLIKISTIRFLHRNIGSIYPRTQQPVDIAAESSTLFTMINAIHFVFMHLDDVFHTT